ncbi:hypothetical protein LIER_33082 [Lithospermum erythrorhizon]|uniref:BHLH domain-containing protein n=1 Tax=Lithospermum erythrorhizon TaxID=34254 RepID=A0AAV3RZD7_LITER
MVKSRKEISLEQSNVQNSEREENYFGDSSSLCSEEASNYPEEEEFVSSLRTTFERRRRNGSKKYHIARKSKLSKKKGKTNKLHKKMRILQQLIPNSSNVDNACVLDEAIEYIKNLQYQLQFILSANAFIAGMYASRMQANMMAHQLYASSIVQNDTFSSCLPSLVGSTNQMPPSRTFTQHPSLIMSNSNVSFSPYGSLMMPFQST